MNGYCDAGTGVLSPYAVKGSGGSGYSEPSDIRCRFALGSGSLRSATSRSSSSI